MKPLRLQVASKSPSGPAGVVAAAAGGAADDALPGPGGGVGAGSGMVALARAPSAVLFLRDLGGMLMCRSLLETTKTRAQGLQ